ncbi:hypothetical protein EFN42_05645, partial [Leuconostoc mesenteroides]|nr:hypothetical protein [Leuconostoc mesenteroides]
QCETNENTQLAITTKGFSAVCSVRLILAIYHILIMTESIIVLGVLLFQCQNWLLTKKKAVAFFLHDQYPVSSVTPPVYSLQINYKETLLSNCNIS